LGDLACQVVGRYRKFVASQKAKGPVDPFIDPAGYRAYLDAGEKELREGKTHQQQHDRAKCLGRC
jgi:hypothetical protein